jgi:hypothetical protein
VLTAACSVTKFLILSQDKDIYMCQKSSLELIKEKNQTCSRLKLLQPPR